MEGCVEDGIDGGQQRLHHVVEHMEEADSRQHTEHGSFFGGVGGVYCLLRDGLSAHSGFLRNLFIVMLAILSNSLLSRTGHSLSRTVRGTDRVRASPIV